MEPVAHAEVGGRLSGARVALLLFSCGCALGWGASAAKNHAPPRPAASDAPAMHAPQAHTESNDPLGALQPVAVPAQPEASKEPPVASATAAPAPIRLAREPAPEPYPLRDRDLALPGGLIIHGVPSSVSVRKAADLESGEPVFEFVDARGHRLALLKQTALARIALPGGGPLLQDTASTHTESARDDWDKTRINVVVDRFQSESHLYTLERRSADTDWIMNGLDLSSH